MKNQFLLDLKTKEQIIITVTDEGIGIDENIDLLLHLKELEIKVALD